MPPASSPASGAIEGRECVIVVQRLHDQGRHLLSDDGEEACARAGDRAREPAALHLSRRQRRRESAALDRSVSRPRSFRPHLLQSGDDVGGGYSADRGRDGLLHGRRRLRSGDGGRNHHRAQAGHDLSRRAAAGESGDRRGGDRGRARRRRRACAQIRRRRSLCRRRPPCARDRAPDRRQSQRQEDRRHPLHRRRAIRNTTPPSSKASCRWT